MLFSILAGPFCIILHNLVPFILGSVLFGSLLIGQYSKRSSETEKMFPNFLFLPMDHCSTIVQVIRWDRGVPFKRFKDIRNLS